MIKFKLFFFLLLLSSLEANMGFNLPIKFISSCELDLNGDGKLDIAILIESTYNRELIALIRNNDQYDSYVLVRGEDDMFMSCHLENELKETTAGKGNKQTIIHKTNGAYLEVIYSESSSKAFFWKNGNFNEVWTSD